MPKHLVIGASGTVGSNVVNLLANEGHAVRATTSRLFSKSPRDNVEWSHLDLVRGMGIEEAFADVDTALLLSPPGFADQHRVLSPLITAATRRKLDKVVLMTAMGADAADTPFRRAEVELESSGLAWNIIRPNWFMQNFQTFWLQGINEQGKILLPVGKGKASFIDARDIAAVAVRLLTTHDEDQKAFDVTGPEALDHDQVASILSEVTGRRIVYQEIEPRALRDGFVAAGVPADYADFLIAILGYLKQGYAAPITDAVKKLLGREPIAFRQYARDERAAWKPALAAA